MPSDKINKEDALEVLRVMEGALSIESSGSNENSQFAFDDDFDDDFDNAEITTNNLSLIPDSEWDRLKVSKKSFLTDLLWDFREEGSPLYVSRTKICWVQEVDDGIFLTSLPCVPLRLLLQACLYYYLPQNCILGSCRSYNSVLPMFVGFMKVARFLYRKGLYVDVYGNGAFETASALTEDEVLNFIDEQPTIFAKNSVAFAVRFWQNLSQSGFLPGNFTLTVSAVSKALVQKLRKERIDNVNTFMPISLETLSVVVPHCISLVEKYTEDIVSAYEAIHQMFGNKKYKDKSKFSWQNVIKFLSEYKSELWSIDDFLSEEGSLNTHQKNPLIKAITNHPAWATERMKYFPNRRETVGKASNKKVLEVAKNLGIDLYSFGDGTILYDLRKIRNHFQGIFSTFRDACLILLCLVTGMRRSELLHIKAKKAWLIAGSKDDYSLEFTVFKTDEASQGATVVIPIPEVGYKAYSALERITEPARRFGSTDYLCTNISFYFGDKMHPNRINSCLERYWRNLGIEEHIHTHMFRKTLAMFAIYQDPRNITVIKYLYSHKSFAMTLAYIVKIPGLSEEIKLAVIQHNMDLLAEVITAAKNERIGGKCGIRIKEQLKTSKFFARLNDEGRESLRQYVDSLLEQGLRLLHRCPLNVICTNMHDSVIHIGPELCDCEVTNCDYAVFTDESVPDLIEQVRFHEQWITHPNVSDDQVRFSKRIIKDCLERLSEVQGEDVAMAQFPQHYGLVA